MTIGRMTVLRELGRGAGSRVFLVRLAADGREYALKVVPVGDRRTRKYLGQARNEYRVGRQLCHPNLVRVYRLEEDGGWFSAPTAARLLLEYLPGDTLDRLPPLPHCRLARAFERVADAVAHMHARGFVHADLKPNNLMLGPDAGVRVIDFGLARAAGEAAGRVQGTPEYMAPETGAHKLVSERTDIYNLGATLYRLVAGRPPVPPASAVMFGGKAFDRLVVPVGVLAPDAPAGLCELIHRCLSHDPAARPGSMAEVRDALAALARMPQPSPDRPRP